MPVCFKYTSFSFFEKKNDTDAKVCIRTHITSFGNLIKQLQYLLLLLFWLNCAQNQATRVSSGVLLFHLKVLSKVEEKA